MLTYAIILMVPGGGFAGWMGYQSSSSSRSFKARSAARNHWLKMHALAKETDEQEKTGSEKTNPEG